MCPRLVRLVDTSSFHVIFPGSSTRASFPGKGSFVLSFPSHSCTPRSPCSLFFRQSSGRPPLPSPRVPRPLCAFRSRSTSSDRLKNVVLPALGKRLRALPFFPRTSSVFHYPLMLRVHSASSSPRAICAMLSSTTPVPVPAPALTCPLLAHISPPPFLSPLRVARRSGRSDVPISSCLTTGPLASPARRLPHACHVLPLFSASARSVPRHSARPCDGQTTDGLSILPVLRLLRLRHPAPRPPAPGFTTFSP
ncbi:hypothetical protein TRVL_08747 [Trypanosoma vivax]|nr:hypothetical protein TRVL_08747 [Trypanosoma vivax]